MGKCLCQSLFFNKVAGFRFATLLKKSLCHMCFPVNVVKFLTEHLRTTASEYLPSKFERINKHLFPLK